MVELDEVAEYLEQYKPYGGYGMACCPFHDDHSPSLQVSSTGYHCKSCGARGGLNKLYAEVSGKVVIREKVYNPSAWIWRNWGEKFGSIQAIAKYAHHSLLHNPQNWGFLEQRKVDGCIKSGTMGLLESYFLFPIKDEYEQVQGIVARASPTIQTKNNRYSVSPNCPVKLYVPNWRHVLKADELYVCYGTLDAWTLEIAGYAGLTGISGQELSPFNLDRFHKPMYIIPDKGEEKSALELQCSLGWRGMSLFLDWPDGTKDLNGVHQIYGIEKVIELIEKAKRRYSYE